MRGRVGKWLCIWNWERGSQRCYLHQVLIPELENPNQLTNTRREALSLYRDIIRVTRFFTWPDSRGFLWRDVLRENARAEFEHARFETDPEIVTRLLIGGREALHSAANKLAEKHKQPIQKYSDQS